MPIPAAVAIGAPMAASALGGVLGGVFGSSGAKAQAKAMRAAIEYQKQKDAETQQRFIPYQELGKESVNEFQNWRDDPTKDPMAYLDPAYEFMRDQGLASIYGNAATAGMLQSGDTLRAATQYGQDYSNTAYDNAFKRWLQEGEFKKGLVGLGQTAAAQQGQLATQGAANVGEMTSNYDAGGSDKVWADVLSGMGGMAGNALARRFAAQPKGPTTPGGSNIFEDPDSYGMPNYYGVPA